MGVAIWLTSLTLVIVLFQRYLLGHYHAIDKHIEVLSLDVISGSKISCACSYLFDVKINRVG